MTNIVRTISIDTLLDQGVPDTLICGTGFLKHDFKEIPVFHFVESIVLQALVKHYKPSSILEIGTSTGMTAGLMQLNAPSAKVVTIDLADEFQSDYTKQCLNRRSAVGKDLDTLGIESKVKRVLVDPSKPLEAYEELNQKFDLILIDGDHSYDGVKKDTEFAMRAFSGKGAIIWHDYYPIPNYIKDPDKRGVYPVVQESVDHYGYDIKHIMGSCFAIAASNLPEGTLFNIKDIENTPWDQNVRIKHLYGERQK